MTTTIRLRIPKDIDPATERKIRKLKGSLIAQSFTDIIHFDDDGEDFYIHYFTTSTGKKQDAITDPNNLDVFKFWIDEKTILDYWLSPKTSRSPLKVHFEALDGNYEFLNSYNEMFAIQGIYDTQTDLAEELVHKAKVYTNAYQKSLVDNFKDLFPDQSMIKRLIVGNYMESNEIHKRPMSKYSQDIAKQLGLI